MSLHKNNKLKRQRQAGIETSGQGIVPSLECRGGLVDSRIR